MYQNPNIQANSQICKFNTHLIISVAEYLDYDEVVTLMNTCKKTFNRFIDATEA